MCSVNTKEISVKCSGRQRDGRGVMREIIGGVMHTFRTEMGFVLEKEELIVKRCFSTPSGRSDFGN